MMRLDKYLAERTGMTRSESRKAVTKGRVMVGGMVAARRTPSLTSIRPRLRWTAHRWRAHIRRLSISC